MKLKHLQPAVLVLSNLFYKNKKQNNLEELY